MTLLPERRSAWPPARRVIDDGAHSATAQPSRSSRRRMGSRFSPLASRQTVSAIVVKRNDRSVCAQRPRPVADLRGLDAAPRPCATRSTSRSSPTSSAITATGWPSTTAAPMLAGAEPRGPHRPDRHATTRLRVGSGGVMLPHYSPLKVAENFSILAGLFPDRIDLALGRAPGTDPLTTFALQRDRRQAAPDDFPTQLAELLGLLEDRLPGDHPFARLSDLPGPPARARALAAGLLAAERRSGPRSSACPTPSPTSSTRPAPRSPPATGRSSVDTGRLEAPRVAVGVSAICAETDEEAQLIAASARMAFAMLRRGDRSPCRRRRRPCASSSPRARRWRRRRPGAARSSARRRPWPRGLRRGRRGVRRRRADRRRPSRHDHARPPALVRADRRGLRPRRGPPRGADRVLTG